MESDGIFGIMNISLEQGSPRNRPKEQHPDMFEP